MFAVVGEHRYVEVILATSRQWYARRFSVGVGVVHVQNCVILGVVDFDQRVGGGADGEISMFHTFSLWLTCGFGVCQAV